jgi:hypothetical protein
MKRMAWIAIGAALLFAASGATAQSLGDVARSNRKGKLQQTSASTTHHFDNDNLPKEDHLSVVGPAPDANSQTTAAASASSQAGTAPGVTLAGTTPAQPATDPKAQQADRAKSTAEWQTKLEEQKAKIAALSHELELTQREYRLKAVAMYSDAGNRLRNSAEWDKEDRDYKQQLDEKQKAVDAAKQDLDKMNEDARKAGVPSSARE